MFVQTSKTTINGRTYECKTVRESYRTDKGPRSRTVCNISKLPAHVQDLISAALKNPGCRLVPSNLLGLHDALGFGGVAVLMDAWTRYGLDNVLAGVEGKLERGRIMAMVFSRHLFPGSKLSLKTSSADSALSAAAVRPKSVNSGRRARACGGNREATIMMPCLLLPSFQARVPSFRAAAFRRPATGRDRGRGG